jgi:hypothetical protein
VTARNWTAIGAPGVAPGPIVDPWGLVTPAPGGPSLDCWMQPEGGPLLAASAQPATAVRQRMQGRLPVVATAFEVQTLRLATEAWVTVLGAGPAARAWVVAQAVVFNLSDDPARGWFYFAVRPFNPEGVAPVTRIAYRDGAFLVEGRLAAVALPRPHAWDCDPGLDADLASALPRLRGRSAAANPAGLCHGVAGYAYRIAPWEEAEFLVFLPLGRPPGGRGARRAWPGAAPAPARPARYALLKGAATREWQAALDRGMTLRLPDTRLEESWAVNVGRLLTLLDGDSIVAGPATYRRFWMRDAAYMLAALAACGQGAAAWQVLRGYPRRQRADGRFRGPAGEWDATGAALWTMDRVDRLAPDAEALAGLWPAARRGAAWIARARRGPRPAAARGLLPAGRGANHFGPADYYYWDDFWALAGLEAVAAMAGRLGRPTEAARWRREAASLRAALARSLRAAALPDGTAPAAPGRGADSALVSMLAAWWPLELYPATDSRLPATLAALDRVSSYDGVFFQRIAHQGWGTYLNMGIAACLLRLQAPATFPLVLWLLNHASGTYAWPEAINPRTGGGSMGDGCHGWASAAWLLLVRDLLLYEEGDRLVVLAGVPAAWLEGDSTLAAERAPTRFGPVSLRAAWQGATLRLDLEGAPPGGYEARLPRAGRLVELDGQVCRGQDAPPGLRVRVPAGARSARIAFAPEAHTAGAEGG